MIVRRQLYSQNKLQMKQGHDNGMECKPIYNKKAPEHNSTAGGNAIVRDVEDLLKPIQRIKQNDESNCQFLKERTERNLWRNHEVMEMLLTMQQTKALEKLNDKTVKSENVFKDVEAIMHRNGYVKKSHVQIWTKWKFLKSTYMTSRRNGVIPRMVPPPIYEVIHQMITGLNQSLADSCSSADGDSSSVSGMIISGVEGGVSEVGETNEDNEDSFGMAHPIFGFRLGMVKSEPEDTGYEPVDNNNGSDKDPLEKELSPSKSDKEVKEESNNNAPKTSKEPEPVQKILEIPHRGRGRPPKYPPAHIAVPSNTSSPAAKPLPMPPLRVAPFARTIPQNVAVDRPPPPLTMPPASRIQVVSFSNLKNGSTSKFAQPKLIPKPTHQQHSPPVASARITKEQTLTTRATSTPTPSYPKMKQIPMRKTPYSLRPDRAIPDLEASLSPPPLAIEKPQKKFEEVPTTKHLIMQSNSINSQNTAGRKRRADWQGDPVSKHQKYNNIMDEELKHTRSENNDNEKNYGKVLQNVIIDLSSSLRKMQTEMMRDFFNKQNELLEKEHKFQMQQDQMIMKAFQEQTQDIMNSVKQLVGSIKMHKTYQENSSERNIKGAKRHRHVRMQQMGLHQEQRQHDVELENDEMVNNDGNDEETEIDDEEQDQGQEDNEMEQDTADMYTDGEEQQDPIDEHDENRVEEMGNISDEEENEDNEHHEAENETQSTIDEPNENGLATESDNQNPIMHMGESSDINEDK